MKAMKEELIVGVRNDLEDQFDQLVDEQKRSFVKIVEDRFKRIIEQWTDSNKDIEACATSLDAPQLPVFTDLGNIDFEAMFNSSDLDFNCELFPTETATGELYYPSDLSDSAYVSMDSPGSPRKVGA